jgi:hypothetical protein
MRAHPVSQPVAESAAGALWGLCTVPSNAASAASDGAADLLVAALVSHGGGAASAAELCAGALRCLAAASAGGRAAVLDAGGLDSGRAAAAAFAAGAPNAHPGAAAQAAGLVADLEAPPPEYAPISPPNAPLGGALLTRPRSATWSVDDFFPDDATVAEASAAAAAMGAVVKQKVTRQCGLFL